VTRKISVSQFSRCLNTTKFYAADEAEAADIIRKSGIVKINSTMDLACWYLCMKFSPLGIIAKANFPRAMEFAISCENPDGSQHLNSATKLNDYDCVMSEEELKVIIPNILRHKDMYHDVRLNAAMEMFKSDSAPR
jgi:hypothetical protein